VATTAKTFSYAVSLDDEGDARSDDGGSVLPHDDAWSPEHLVLAGLARCTLTSLRHHARRVDVAADGRAEASGTVTQRETDGRYAFVRRRRRTCASCSRRRSATASSAPR
jgi:hypothetical protein